jgi:hypothetical protein
MFFKLNGGQLGMRISNSKHNYAHMFLLNDADGKITKTKKVEFKVSIIELNGIRGTSFPTGYSFKETFGKNNLNVDTFFAEFASPKVAEFFKSVKDKSHNYNSYVLADGVYILEENLTSKAFRLMKFDW